MDKQAASIAEISNWWGQQQENGRTISPEEAIKQGRTALQLGHPTLAYEIVGEALKHSPGNAQLIYLTSLALARGGSLSLAQQTLRPVIEAQPDDVPLVVDVLSLAGSLARDRCSRLEDPEQQRQAANESAAYYESAFTLSGDYFPGINAASMNMLAGNPEQARQLADQVLSICRDLPAEVNNHCLSATLGEASLLKNELDDADRFYRQAVQDAGQHHSDIASMKRQVRLLSRVMPVEQSLLDIFRLPNVVAFAGHMIDKASRPTPRFPAVIETPVYEVIVSELQALDAGIGYTSAACGADLLFIEAMLERGGEVHIVLPFAKDEFINTSVAFAGPKWIGRFISAMSRASSVRYASREGFLNDEILFAYTADQVTGLAILHAGRLGSVPLLLTAADRESRVDVGGTNDNINRWGVLPYKKHVIDIGRIRQQHFPQHGRESRAEQIGNTETQVVAQANKLRRLVQTMLFADVVGFSKLNEENAPEFFVKVMGKMAEVIHGHAPPPVFCNTWGDGLFMVFDEVHVAAEFALQLRDRILATDWAAEGLPTDTSIRIGMHAGPVFRALDPVIQKLNFYGAQVKRAARIEPMTAPGAVFMSEQTACLLTSTGHREFSCDYMGSRGRAKMFDSDLLYRLRRAREIE